MSDDVFDGKILADKLFKLNSSQQSIESLSSSCISQRKKAKQIVEIWHKSFKSAKVEQHVTFLYLANDILQNSRRKGNEFVNEFWKVMPSALKHVTEHGEDNGKKAASRLVGIWDERRVFGSRGQNLKDEMVGKSKTQLANTTTNGNNSSSCSNPIKIVKRDANSLRLKVAVGGTPEKIMTAFHLVHDENDTALNNCEAAIRRFGDFERDIQTQGVVVGSSLVDEIKEQENVLEECVKQLETAERTRTSLISQLKVALQDQELKLDVIQRQLQVARGQIDNAINLKKKLVTPEVNQITNPPLVSEEENKKAAAAAVAAKLTASSSSAQMLTSVLSSLVAQEAAASISVASSLFSPSSKRPKLDQTQPPPPPPTAIMPPYVYAAPAILPPPPPPPQMNMGFHQQQSQPTNSNGNNNNSGYYRPPGIGFYQPTPPPVPR